MRASLFFLLATVAIVTMPAAAHHSHNNCAISEFTLGDTVKVPPMHGDTARGHGVEKEWVNQARRVLRRSN